MSCQQSSFSQLDEGKSSLAKGYQAGPTGMAEVSEEDDLQAAEEVKTLSSLDKIGTKCLMLRVYLKKLMLGHITELS